MSSPLPPLTVTTPPATPVKFVSRRVSALLPVLADRIVGKPRTAARSNVPAVVKASTLEPLPVIVSPFRVVSPTSTSQLAPLSTTTVLKLMNWVPRGSAPDDFAANSSVLSMPPSTKPGLPDAPRNFAPGSTTSTSRPKNFTAVPPAPMIVPKFLTVPVPPSMTTPVAPPEIVALAAPGPPLVIRPPPKLR